MGPWEATDPDEGCLIRAVGGEYVAQTFKWEAVYAEWYADLHALLSDTTEEKP